MTTQVRETAAGQSISAYVVLNKKGEHVATVNAHYSNGGRVSVDVWNLGQAADRCMSVFMKTAAATAEKVVAGAIVESKAKRDWAKENEHSRFAAYDLFGFQQSSASGHGYDKFAAALRGIWIDGHQLADHCGQSPATEKLLKRYTANMRGDYLKRSTQKYWDEKARNIGAHFTNYRDDVFTSLYLETGLKRLETIGYQVIQAI